MEGLNDGRKTGQIKVYWYCNKNRTVFTCAALDPIGILQDMDSLVFLVVSATFDEAGRDVDSTDVGAE